MELNLKPYGQAVLEYPFGEPLRLNAGKAAIPRAWRCGAKKNFPRWQAPAIDEVASPRVVLGGGNYEFDFIVWLQPF